VCLSCKRHFLEIHGTPLHGKQVAPDKLVWAIAALAEGLGIRAVARVFETDPNTVLSWLVAAAEHLKACSRYFVHDLDVEQVQMDELFALLSAVKAGDDVSEQQAMKRLSRLPHWVWIKESMKTYWEQTQFITRTVHIHDQKKPPERTPSENGEHVSTVSS